MTLLLLLGGLILLAAGGELLVRGAAAFALSVGMTPLLVGLTVVAIGTSAPEAAVSIDAAIGGSPELALGNVIGSNIANILLVLGLSALIAPLTVEKRLVRIDLPVMVALSLLTWLLAADGGLTRGEGGLLLGLVLAYGVVTVIAARRRPAAIGVSAAEAKSLPVSTGWRFRLGNLLLVGLGIVLLIIGAGWLVEAATDIALTLGISEIVVGLTVVALGTSLPELATSLIATARGQRDLAVGNVVGSNIANLGLVLGLSALVAAGGIPVPDSVLLFDLPFMVAVALAALPIALTGFVIARWEGAFFVGYLIAYVLYLWLDSTGYERIDAFSSVVFGFVLPLIVGTIVLVAAFEWRSRRRQSV